MTSQEEKTQFSVFRWILVTAVGLLVGLAAGIALGAPVQAVVGMMLVAPMTAAIAGSVLGAHQWFVLRRRLARAWRWIAATGLGLGAGLTLGVVIVEQIARKIVGCPVSVARIGVGLQALSLLAVGCIAGAVLGATQSLLLRWVNGPSRGWMRQTTIALGIALPAGALAANLLPRGLASPAGFGVFAAVAGIVFGSLTGRTLLVALASADR